MTKGHDNPDDVVLKGTAPDDTAHKAGESPASSSSNLIKDSFWVEPTDVKKDVKK